MDVFFTVSELLVQVIAHCDIHTRSILAFTSRDMKTAVNSFVSRKLRSRLQFFVPEPDIDSFWEILDETHAVIGGSFVMDFIFSDLLTESVNNLNILVPNGELPSLMIFFYQLDFDIVHQLPVGLGYTTTTSTIQIMENSNKVSILKPW